MSSQFNNCVSSLLSVDTLANIPEEHLRHFQSQYTQHAFRCRFSPCTGASLGFRTEAIRDAHEQLHLKRLFCDRPNCAIGRIGFQRQRELDKHNKVYHTEGSILVPPRVRRVAPNTSESPNRGVSPREKGRWKTNKTTLPFDESFKQMSAVEDALDLIQLSDPLEQETEHDWGAIFNSQCAPMVDIRLQHVLQHDSVVCCVTIDPHDRRLATGCNHAARVFDLQTGDSLCYLPHALQVEGDCFVRSVCFSPDGTQLATAGEDSLLKVILYPISD